MKEIHMKRCKKSAAMLVAAGLVTGTCGYSFGDSQLPKPDKGFKGEMNTTILNSKPYWPPRYEAPKGAPNVVIIMTDDVGFSAGSVWGGPVNTPVQERLAKEGLRYNQFHTTAISSPTRAALLTGRNHHMVHTGNIMETSLGYPGYNTLLGKDTATIAEMLRLSGYNTAWIGKNHNLPDFEANSVIGPLDRWPTSLGFEKFYGFMGGESDQYHPYSLYDGTTPIAPYIGNKDYFLNKDLSDQAINWVKQQKTLAPDKPFLLYYTPGGTHAPHQVAKEWSDKYKGKFDQGWDKVREETLARQKKLGIAPQNTQLTERPKEIPAWDSLSADEKKVYARQMEVYAGYLEQTDYYIGEVLKAIEEIGQKENTLVIYIMGDNGASGEGAITGSINENYFFNGQTEDIETILKRIDLLGTPDAYNHYSAGWAHAMDTPFQWTKQVASYYGGTRNGLVVSWPKGIKSKGQIRSQWHHIIDIAPTILEVVGIEQPQKVNEIPQQPIQGVSMMYSFNNAKAKSTHTTQYFEMMGYKAMYQDGWIAAAKPVTAPWMQGKSDGPTTEGWELYHVDEDFSQAHDLSAQYPEKLEALKQLFEIQAVQNNVFPEYVNSTTFYIIDSSNRPNVNEGKTKFTYYTQTGHIQESAAPNFRNTSFSIEADIDFGQAVPNGMIVTMGGQFGGFGFWIKDGVAKFGYQNPNPDEYYEVAAKEAMKPGKHKIKLVFESEIAKTKKPGAGGTATIYVDGKKAASGKIDKTIPFRFSLSEYYDIACDYGTTISKEYAVPFMLNGKINKIEVNLIK